LDNLTKRRIQVGLQWTTIGLLFLMQLFIAGDDRLEVDTLQANTIKTDRLQLLNGNGQIVGAFYSPPNESARLVLWADGVTGPQIELLSDPDGGQVILRVERDGENRRAVFMGTVDGQSVMGIDAKKGGMTMFTETNGEPRLLLSGSQDSYISMGWDSGEKYPEFRITELNQRGSTDKLVRLTAANNTGIVVALGPKGNRFIHGQE
jgi:hypothetical protein